PRKTAGATGSAMPAEVARIPGPEMRITRRSLLSPYAQSGLPVIIKLVSLPSVVIVLMAN
ncbi:MAG: hypothetical protein WCA45_09790, partial [Thiobacillaceae bacterium]